MTTHGIALRRFSHAGTGFMADAILLDLPTGQFEDWRDVGLVREATPEELAAFRGDAPPPAPAPARRRTRRS